METQKSSVMTDGWTLGGEMSGWQTGGAEECYGETEMEDRVEAGQ